MLTSVDPGERTGAQVTGPAPELQDIGDFAD
jgi:hypothetical protein